VQWEIADDEAFQTLVQRGSAQALPALAHSVHVELNGLTPDRWYFYRFTALGAQSPVGRTKTLPALGATTPSLRLAYASCQKWEDGHFSAYAHMQRENLDLVLFLGDYLYEYPGTGRSAVRRPNMTPSGGWCLTLDDYRARYAHYKTDPDLQAMHAACPWLMVWDDHEVQNDYAGLNPGRNGEPASDANVGSTFAARRAAAYQAYYEHMPLRASDFAQILAGQGAITTEAKNDAYIADRGVKLYQQIVIGDIASLCLLDTRQYRDRQACTPPPKGEQLPKGEKLDAGTAPSGSGVVDPSTCAAWDDPARSLLGQRQEQWLDQQLRSAGQAGQASATPSSGQARGAWPQWNLIAQQTLLGQRDFRPGAGQRLWNDGWDGYSAARQRLTQSLADHKVPNAVVFGGDVHENWVGHVKADYARPESANVGVEFCGTAITSRSGNANKAPEWLAENPHFTFADTTRKGYGVAHFTPQRLTVNLRAVDSVSTPRSPIETLAMFEVEAGRSQVERR
jgi:alkaline phosphatase D